jgi:rSAM/selenodomain-associated transferase 2
VVVPTLDEEGAIGALLDVVALVRGVTEVIVVDGGSRDATVSIAGDHGVRVLEAVGGGRGAQMRAGADAARGDALLFLHADTLLPPDAAEALTEALAWPWVAGGSFFTRFSGPSRAARFMTWLYPQLHKLGIVYGDSAIFARTSTYRAAGGFRPLPIFEDLDLVRRLRRHGRIVHLPSAVETSSRRFEGRSFPWMLVRWIVMQVLYWLGVSPGRLVRMYAPIRESGPRRVRGRGRQPPVRGETCNPDRSPGHERRPSSPG